MTYLPKNIEENDIYNFFKENSVGKIKNIRMIFDRKTGEFYGKAFVEFYNKLHAEDSLRLNKVEFWGKTITVILASDRF